jgi:hypothetical protein
MRNEPLIIHSLAEGERDKGEKKFFNQSTTNKTVKGLDGDEGRQIIK